MNWYLALFVTANLVSNLFWVLPAHAKNTNTVEVWFAPESHFPPVAGSDFLNLLTNPSLWQQSQKQTDVLQMSSQFFSKAPPDLLQKLRLLIQSSNISLAITMESYCGSAPATKDSAKFAADRIVRAGLSIKYIIMDEPFWNVFAAPLPGENLQKACRFSPKDTTSYVGEIAAVFTRAFPTATLGDIEPFPILFGDRSWIDQYRNFKKGLETYVNKPIAFFQADLNWREPRLTATSPNIVDEAKVISVLKMLETFAHHSQMKLGFIVDGKSNAQSDREWLSQAKNHLLLARQSGVHLQQIAFDSWHKHPLSITPETSADTMTSMLLRLRSIYEQ